MIVYTYDDCGFAMGRRFETEAVGLLPFSAYGPPGRHLVALAHMCAVLIRRYIQHGISETVNLSVYPGGVSLGSSRNIKEPL